MHQFQHSYLCKKLTCLYKFSYTHIMQVLVQRRPIDEQNYHLQWTKRGWQTPVNKVSGFPFNYFLSLILTKSIWLAAIILYLQNNNKEIEKVPMDFEIQCIHQALSSKDYQLLSFYKRKNFLLPVLGRVTISHYQNLLPFLTIVCRCGCLLYILTSYPSLFNIHSCIVSVTVMPGDKLLALLQQSSTFIDSTQIGHDFLTGKSDT
ncbi:hypothetical protein QQP08_017863 [Theobroma cacao]|nr:hypothetical protein QQP08_017863 [Theobroma cacao]